MRRADAADDRPKAILPHEPVPGVAEGTGATDGQLAEPLRELASQPAEVQQRLGYADTLREICQQPATWRETSCDMVQQAPRLAAFLREAGVLDGPGALVLTGSGSSLFAGASVGPALQAALGIDVHVVAAGDILTHPQQVLPPARPWLAVSFARSGNSPESTAAVNLMLSRDPECRHLLVTCCRTGRLAASFSDDPRVLSVVLNERTCDRSLVMTSSFTNMVIAASILGSLDDTARYRERVAALSRAADHLLGRQVRPLADLARRSVRAVVFLGVGCRYGAAREASLKLTEMSDGLVVSFAETYLSLRHGPMSAIREDTLVVCFLSSDPTARAFEVDLILELNRKRLGAGKVLVGEAVPGDLAAEGDLVVEYSGTAALGDDSAPVLDVLAAQLLGFFRCLHLGLRPDSPSASGVINRVVEPFTIHRES